MKKIIKALLISLCTFSFIHAQGPARFAGEVEEILQKEGPTPAAPVIFTGSSSVRMWKSLAQDFPDDPVLNRGFGGSQMSDLLYFLDRLVIQDQPKQVFIYEGDNDLNGGKKAGKVTRDFKKGWRTLRKALPATEIVIISPKPSPSRWQLKAVYEDLNRRLAKLADRKEGIRFVDVWTPMLNEQGEPKPDIFIEDRLHMNAAGYAIWREVIGPYIIR